MLGIVPSFPQKKVCMKAGVVQQGPWRDVNQVEIATAEWVVWFNTERPHEYLDDFTPEAAEKLHYDHRHTPTMAG